MTITKVIKTSRKISAFGGINFVIDHLNSRRLPELFDSHLGKRVKQAKYSYSNLIISWICANMCGADCLEDIMAIRDELQKRPGFKVPSSDRLSGIFRSFAIPNEKYDNKGIKHEFNIPIGLNDMMLKTAKRLKVIKGNILDYDNTILFNKKADCKMTYKMQLGYQPGVAFIGQTPVYIENRNGNSTARYRIKETVERTLDQLNKHQIKVKYFRSDSAAYNQHLFKSLQERGISFVVRAISSEPTIEHARFVRNWKIMYIGGVRFEVGSAMGEYRNQLIRYVFYRRPSVTVDKTVQTKHKYWAIATNIFDWPEERVIRFYNKRGAIERNFDDLKNSFAWKKIPFSYLNENAVFLIISAISSIVYQHVIRYFSSKLKFVKRTYRMKNFRYHFINVAAWWGEGGKLYIDSQKGYEVLLE